jgi:hypothetical protein
MDRDRILWTRGERFPRSQVQDPVRSPPARGEEPHVRQAVVELVAEAAATPNAAKAPGHAQRVDDTQQSWSPLIDAEADELEIDLSEAETYEPFEAKVPVEIVAAATKFGKESKKPYLELKLRVFEGEFEKRVLWTNINLTGKGAGFGVEKLAAFGYAIDKDKPRVKPSALVGLKATAACAPDEREEYAHKVVVGKITRYVSEAEASADELK